jgi:hypothetical protein
VLKLGGRIWASATRLYDVAAAGLVGGLRWPIAIGSATLCKRDRSRSPDFPPPAAHNLCSALYALFARRGWLDDMP